MTWWHKKDVKSHVIDLLTQEFLAQHDNVALTHWGRLTHICVDKLTNIDSDNGLSPERRQAIIWTNVGILLIGPLGTNFSEILIEIQTLSLKKIRLKMSSAKCCSLRLGLYVLSEYVCVAIGKTATIIGKHVYQLISIFIYSNWIWTLLDE